MGKSKKKKQQKLSAKRGRKTAKRKTTGARSRRQLSSPGGASYPIHETLISDSLFEVGMGTGSFTRLLPDGEIALSSFLLDVFCLGVKDAHHAFVSREEYHDFKARAEETHHLVEIAPECLLKLILDAVDYARSLGFSPHKDYRKAKKIFGSIQAYDCDETFEFGQDGKPFYIPGPNDTPAKIATIQAQLERSVGADGFNFMFPLDEEDLYSE